MSSLHPTCPIDKGHNNCSLFWQFSVGETEFRLFKCEKCDLVFYDPFPEINYENHTDSIASLKDYVHLNANIEGLIGLLVNNLPETENKRMLEVGCGFGFTLDFAKRVLHMDVVGYEPSLYGEIGANELDLDIRRTYLTKEDLVNNKYDIIFLSEVLEHIQNPLEFILLLKSGLSENGVLILTTPDYKQLQRDLSVPSELALLSPEAHVILFAERSLHKILSDAGFSDINITAPGTSLIAVSSLRKQKRKQYEDYNHLIRLYFKDILESVKPSSLTYVGVLYRLLRNYVDRGEYVEASKLIGQYPFPILPSAFEVNQIRTESALDDLTVNCAAMLSYYLGILRLNFYQDFRAAADSFLVSHLLCKKRLQLVPHASVLEFGIVWLAKYHEALAISHLGNYQEALSVVNELITFNHGENAKNIPLPAQDIIKQAKDLRSKIVEEL
jgi:SAM-dependent methyltransferase